MRVELSESIGEEIERVYYISDGSGGFKSITLCFKSGKSLIFESRTHLIIPNCPFIHLTEAEWDLVKAVPEPIVREPGTPDLSEIDGADQD